jgi:hypothetical protein
MMAWAKSHGYPVDFWKIDVTDGREWDYLMKIKFPLFFDEMWADGGWVSDIIVRTRHRRVS